MEYKLGSSTIGQIGKTTSAAKFLTLANTLVIDKYSGYRFVEIYSFFQDIKFPLNAWHLSVENRSVKEFVRVTIV